MVAIRISCYNLLGSDTWNVQPIVGCRYKPKPIPVQTHKIVTPPSGSFISKIPIDIFIARKIPEFSSSNKSIKNKCILPVEELEAVSFVVAPERAHQVWLDSSFPLLAKFDPTDRQCWSV
jgi:hypothetical protein